MDIDYDSSYVSIRRKRYSYDLIPRHTEIAGIDRRAYGGRQPATHSAASVSTAYNDLLKCSDCKLMRHFEQFPLSRRYLHRHAVWIETKQNGKKIGQLCGREYLCNDCKHRRYTEAKAAALSLALFESRQAKPVKLSKKERKAAKRKLEKNQARAA